MDRPGRTSRKLMTIAVSTLLVLALVMYIWASDRISFQGERTVYTVTCVGGTWEEHHCTGTLAPSDRYVFRASRSRQEVLYWIFGSSVPSGKYSDCRVQSRGNWSCNVTTGERLTITYEMKNDHPVEGAEGLALPFHAVTKWKWWALRYKIVRLTDAEP